MDAISGRHAALAGADVNPTVVADSDPDGEYEETLHKARALRRANSSRLIVLWTDWLIRSALGMLC